MSTFSLQGAADIAAQQDKGVRITLKDQLGDALTYTKDDGSLVECTALVAGQLSATYRKAEDTMRDRQLKRRSVQLTGEMLARQQMELIAACVLDWNLHDGPKPIPCTKENVITVFTAAPWIRADIEAVMSDPARFLG
jgi:hypothetical protein